MTSTTTPGTERAPSWDGIPDLVPLHRGVGAGGCLVTILLTGLTFGLILPIVAWDYWRRANAVGRDGIHTYSGILPWAELDDAVVDTRHTSRRGRITATVYMARLRFRSRTIDVGPWGAPDPELVMRALSAGAGRRLDIPRPSGNVR